MIIDHNHRCMICKRVNVMLFSMYAPGECFLCADCIKEEEIKYDKVAVLSMRGVVFLDRDEVLIEDKF